MSGVKYVVIDILEALREHETLSAAQLDRIVRAHSKRAHDGRRYYAKKRILPYYLRVKAEAGPLWESWHVDSKLDERFVKTLQMKPRRTASGVATITVITKPWPCANSCIYCPNDPHMPKSYLSDEPACQRAERNHFHPYLQVASRLHTLEQMGHSTDKIELIVLGGTWLDYPESYRLWFIYELFSALNDDEGSRAEALANGAINDKPSPTSLTLDDLYQEHQKNEEAAHRVVGLVVETRPDTITPSALKHLRQLGCTKLQLGVQSINDELLCINGRRETASRIAESFMLCRLFGFKLHAHFMVNLLGATPESDRADYRTFAHAPEFQPDEVKLYPCALVEGTELVNRYHEGLWKPYTEDELIAVLSQNLLDTPAFMRVSRMIRDISAKDILVGNKKTNLRQLVEEHLAGCADQVREIRYREVGTSSFDFESLKLEEMVYGTLGTQEHFLQWVDSQGRIAAFLRLSLPQPDVLRSFGDSIPLSEHDAMIREVHVYGFATGIDRKGASAQHRGLGRKLVERACEIARDSGYQHMNVISAIGTRAYYRKLGFTDNGLYQRRAL